LTQDSQSSPEPDFSGIGGYKPVTTPAPGEPDFSRIGGTTVSSEAAAPAASPATPSGTPATDQALGSAAGYLANVNKRAQDMYKPVDWSGYPEPVQKTVGAVTKYLKGMVPQDTQQWLRAAGVPTQAPTNYEGIKQWMGFIAPPMRMSLDFPEQVKNRAEEIHAADQTPAGSQERYDAGIGTVLDLLQLAGLKGMGEIGRPGIGPPRTTPGIWPKAVAPEPVPGPFAPGNFKPAEVPLPGAPIPAPGTEAIAKPPVQTVPSETARVAPVTPEAAPAAAVDTSGFQRRIDAAQHEIELLKGVEGIDPGRIQERVDEIDHLKKVISGEVPPDELPETPESSRAGQIKRAQEMYAATGGYGKGSPLGETPYVVEPRGDGYVVIDERSPTSIITDTPITLEQATLRKKGLDLDFAKEIGQEAAKGAPQQQQETPLVEPQVAKAPEAPVAADRIAELEKLQKEYNSKGKLLPYELSRELRDRREGTFQEPPPVETGINKQPIEQLLPAPQLARYQQLETRWGNLGREIEQAVKRNDPIRENQLAEQQIAIRKEQRAIESTLPDADVQDSLVLGTGPGGNQALISMSSEGLRAKGVESSREYGGASKKTIYQNVSGSTAGAEMASKRAMADRHKAMRHGAQYEFVGEVLGTPQFDPVKKIFTTEFVGPGKNGAGGKVERSRTITVATGTRGKGAPFSIVDDKGNVITQSRVTGSPEDTSGVKVHLDQASPAITEARENGGGPLLFMGSANSSIQGALLAAGEKGVGPIHVIYRRKAPDASDYLRSELETAVKEGKIILHPNEQILSIEKPSASNGFQKVAISQKLDAKGKAIPGAIVRTPGASVASFLGGTPDVDFLRGVAKDAKGYLITSGKHEIVREVPDVNAKGEQRFQRDPDTGEKVLDKDGKPIPLTKHEAVPGMFAAGSVESGSISRMPTSLGAGTAAQDAVFKYLLEREKEGNLPAWKVSQRHRINRQEYGEEPPETAPITAPEGTQPAATGAQGQTLFWKPAFERSGKRVQVKGAKHGEMYVDAETGLPTITGGEIPGKPSPLHPLTSAPQQQQQVTGGDELPPPPRLPVVVRPPETSTQVTGKQTVEFPIDRITLSKDVPQFKAGANERGVVEPLAGKYERTGTAPVQLWERANGDTELISGRHRFDLAQRTGERTIPSQIHREAEGFDSTAAARLDAELNIRDEKGSVGDYANYFRNSKLSQADAEARGLLARSKGQAGFTIARDGSEDLFALHQSGRLTDSQASEIAQAAPENPGAQRVGIKVALEGGPANLAANTVKAAIRRAADHPEETPDLFRSDDSAMQQMKKQAARVTKIQRGIRQQIAAVQGASRNPAMASKLGVDVKDPVGVQRRVKELKNELLRWDNWPMHDDLVAITHEGEFGAQPPLPMKLGPAEPRVEIRKSQPASVSYGRGMDNYRVPARHDIMVNGELRGKLWGTKQGYMQKPNWEVARINPDNTGIQSIRNFDSKQKAVDWINKNPDAFAPRSDAPAANKSPEQLDMDLGKAADKGSTLVENASPGEDHIQMGMNKVQIANLLSRSMYDKPILEVSTKELLQNALDTSREAGATAANPKKIHIDYDTDARTITVKDSGMGMTPETIQKAFFTIGGTKKTGSPENTSGGLGVAKMAFQLGSERIKLVTVKDGLKSTVDVSSKEIAATLEEGSKATIRVLKEKTDEPNGTTVTVKIPKSYVDKNGETQPIYFHTMPDVLDEPLFAPVEVIKNGQTLPIGVNQKGWQKDNTFNFSWGKINAYVKPGERTDYPKFKVLSAGLHQFDVSGHEVYGFGNENPKIPYHFALDVRPNVRGDSPAYPFNNQREGFRSTIKKDTEAMFQYFKKQAVEQQLLEAQDVFKKLKQLPEVDPFKSLTKEQTDRIESASRSPTKVAPYTPKKVTAVDIGKDRIVTHYTSGETETHTPEDYVKPSFKPEREINFEKTKLDVSGLDPNKPYLHNNTTVEYADIPGAAEFETKIGNTLIKYMREVGGKVGEQYAGLAKTDSSAWRGGVSYDKTYRGLNIVNPFKAIWVNPGGLSSYARISPESAAAETFYLFNHEITHVSARSEGAAFTREEGTNAARFVSHGVQQEKFLQALRNIYAEHWDTFNEINRRHQEYDTKNRAESFKSDAALGPERQDQTEPTRKRVSSFYAQGDVRVQGQRPTGTGRAGEADRQTGNLGDVLTGTPADERAASGAAEASRHSVNGEEPVPTVETQPARGPIGWDEALTHGKDWLARGGDPDQVVSKFQRTGRVTTSDMGIARAHLNDLQSITNQIGDALRSKPKDPGLMGRFNEALDAEEKFSNQYRPMEAVARESLPVLNGSAPIDERSATSYTGLMRRFKELRGRDPMVTEEVRGKEYVEKNKKADVEYGKATADVYNSLENEFKRIKSDRTGPPTLDWISKIKEVCG
jgi:thioredoxin reductase